MKGLMLMVSALTLALTGAAAAQDKYPSKPIKIVVPYPPGGSADLIGRMIAEKLAKSLKSPAARDGWKRRLSPLTGPRPSPLW